MRSVLVAAPDMTRVNVDDSLFVYDERGKRFFVLNTSAAAVYDAVDGRTSADEIADTLAALHPDQAEAVRRDVAFAIDGLLELGVVAEEAAGATRAMPTSPA
jgi:hypothetical protein